MELVIGINQACVGGTFGDLCDHWRWKQGVGEAAASGLVTELGMGLGVGFGGVGEEVKIGS